VAKEVVVVTLQIHEKLDLIGEMRDVSAMMAHTSSHAICICGIIIG